MATIRKLQPGQELYEVRRAPRGSDNAGGIVVCTVLVEEVDPDRLWVLARIDGGTPDRYLAPRVAHWKYERPAATATRPTT